MQGQDRAGTEREEQVGNLIYLHKGKPSRDLLRSLLDMLVDDSFQPSNMVIQNEDVVLLFFNILQRCNEHDQVYGLDTFQLLLEESTANRAACVRAGLLSLLLEWFAKESEVALIVKFGHLMKMIGGHSISGKDMRSIFALLRSSKDGLRPRHGTLLLQIFQGMLKEQGPAVFFDFSGRDSGIVVTSPLRWPSTRGFSFCAWARVESFPGGSSPKVPEGMMGLFSFLSESGKGCTASISSDQLVVESINTKRQITSLKVQLQTKRWYHICVTHNTQRALNGGNTIKVYIDGVLASSERLRYSKIGEVLTRCTIGASFPITTVDGIGFSKISGRYAAAFCGQLGPIYLFDDAMSAEQAKGVFSLGPDYMYSFLPSEVGYVPENISTDSIINEKDGLAFKMVFGYNAQASSGRALFDISPVLEYSPDPVLYDATIMAGTLLCYRHLVQDSVQCVGGIGVFFPLLTQLDQPVCTTSSVMVNTCDQKHVEGYPVDSHVAVEVIDLLTAVLADNLANQQYMRNMSGMSILGFLLQSVSPQHLTVNVVAALERLVTTVAKGSGASLATALVKEALVKLYFNPHIWIFTPLVVHRELYVSLIKYFKNDGSLLRSVCGLPRVLDMLRHFYWDKPKRKALGTKPLLHPVTKAVIGERPNRLGISELRQLVLVLTEGVLREKVTLIDVKALVAFLETNEDEVCVKDVLYMILGLLTQKTFVSSFIEHLNALGGITILLNLIRRKQEVIRLLAFRLIGVLVVAMVDKKVAGSSFLGTSKATAEFQRVEKIRINHVFSVMSESVAMFPFSDAVRATIFDILLGEACPKQLIQECSNSEQDNPVAAKSLSRAKLTSQISNFFRVPEKSV